MDLRINIRTNSTEFIEKAKFCHGDKYDYSLIVEFSKISKVKIICPKHGIFEKWPRDHLKTNGWGGCQLCSNENQSRIRRQTAEDFISNANIVHDNKYTYNNVVYKNSATKVMITCPEHGDFPQKPQNHILGDGCPACPGNYTGDGFVYVLKCNKNYSTFKIGHTSSIERRMRDFNNDQAQKDAGFDLALCESYEVHNRSIVESLIHAALKEYHAGLTGFHGATEVFVVNEGLMFSIINNIINEYLIDA